MPAPHLIAYQDVIDHLTAYAGGVADEKNQRATRTAVQSAYRIIANARNWNYFWTVGRVQLSAPYSTGTIAYTASTRIVTLTSGTWPSWALYGHIQIGTVIHRVQSRDSDTQVTLEPTLSGASDVSSGTSYTLFRSIYTAPYNFKAMCRPVPENGAWSASYLSPESWMRLERVNTTSGTPTAWTILADSNLVGSRAIHVWPYPSAAATYDFLYQRYPRQLRFTGYGSAEGATGTVTGTAGAATISGTSTNWDATMEGSLIRFTSGTTHPDGIDGLNPWTEQKVIVDVSSTTAGTLDSNLVNTYSAKKFRITDPVDLAPHMIEAFLRCAEYQLAIKKQMTTVPRAAGLYTEELIRAFEADAVFTGPRVAGGGGTMAYDITDMPLDLTGAT
jgi:hypothetical protein